MKLSRAKADACCLSALLLVGCGGGGGGSGGGDSTPTTPPLSTDPDAPTMVLVAAYPAREGAAVMFDAFEQGRKVLSYARFTADIAHRFAAADSPMTVTADCAYSGTITLRLTDSDNDGRASAGDVITAVLDNCGVPNLSRAATGTLRVDIVSAAPSADKELRARLTVVDPLQLKVLAGGGNQGVIAPGTLRGSMAVQWTATATGSLLKATSTSADDLRYTGPFENTDGLNQLDVSQTVRYDRATISTSMNMLIRGAGGGRLRVRTPQAMDGDLNAVPKQMHIEIDAAAGWMLRADRTAATVTGIAQVRTQVVDPSGVVTNFYENAPDWYRLRALIQDGRWTSSGSNFTDVGSGPRTLLPWYGTGGYSEIDAACQRVVTAGINRFRADALFQLPVAAQSTLMSAGALVKLQFGRAIADNTPAMRFRWFDIGAGNIAEGGTLAWAVETTVVRSGSYYEIRSAEPLRRGHQYALKMSFDGVNWDTTPTLYDAQGQVVTVGGVGVGSIWTDGILMARTTYADTGLVNASVPAQLRSTVDMQLGQSVRSYRWQQISGVPLVLATPDASATTAVPVAAGLLTIGEAVMQLNVVDSLGNTDYARVTLQVGNHRPQGAAFYSIYGNDQFLARQSLITGTGSIFLGPASGLANGVVGPRIEAASAGGTGVSFTIAAPGGARLAVGSYPDAVRNFVPGAQPLLVTNLLCDLGDPGIHSFEVLEVQYAADGSIGQLAVDIVQSCRAGQNDYQRAGYRYNSAIPLHP